MNPKLRVELLVFPLDLLDQAGLSFAQRCEGVSVSSQVLTVRAAMPYIKRYGGSDLISCKERPFRSGIITV